MTQKNVVFVYGALRSGTTVVRLMLDSHPQIANPGEMDFLFDYLHETPDGWSYDKEAMQLDRIFIKSNLTIPDNLDGLELLADFVQQLRQMYAGDVMSINLHRHADKATKALPEARFVHILRDPRDVARSMIGMGWAGTLYHAVRIWRDTERKWDAAKIPADKTLTVQYEELIQSPEKHLTDICHFMGTTFDDGMLTYYENTTYSAPDPALTYQWRKKANATEIAQLESQVADLMRARGYEPVGDPAPLGFLDKLGLYISNKKYVWAFGVKRHGVIVFFGEKISRGLRLKGLNLHFKERIMIDTQKYLK